MKHYPTMADICSTMCNPKTCLYDPRLREGTVAKNNLGMAVARSGGFACVFKVTNNAKNKSWAVRVFHRDCAGRADRNKIIAQRIRQLVPLGYFLPFEFQEKGIMVNGLPYEIVVMDWLEGGEELCEYITNHLHDSVALQNVRMSLLRMHRDLTNAGVAHGDIQPANMRIFDGGKTIKLLDYDGFFCPALKQAGPAESGCLGFQHPERATSGYWDIGLDRFSFIVLDVALRLLLVDPSLWTRTKSVENDIVVFSDADLRAPASSNVFKMAKSVPGCRAIVSALADICTRSIHCVPDPGSYAIPTYCGQVRRVTTLGRVTNHTHVMQPRRFDWRKLTYFQMLAAVALTAVVSMGVGMGIVSLIYKANRVPAVRVCEKPVVKRPMKKQPVDVACPACRGRGYVMVRTWDDLRFPIACDDCLGLGVKNVDYCMKESSMDKMFSGGFYGFDE